MRPQKYKLRLREKERIILENILEEDTHTTSQKKRAEVLLELDDVYYYACWLRPQEIVASRCEVSKTTVYKISKQYVEDGLQAVISRKKREKPPVDPILTAEKEAEIIMLASSAPPEGYRRWTLRLLEKRVIELGINEHVSDTTIGRILKKHKMIL